MRISDWSSDVCSSDLNCRLVGAQGQTGLRPDPPTDRTQAPRRAPQIGGSAAAGSGTYAARRRLRACSAWRALPDTGFFASGVALIGLWRLRAAGRAPVNRSDERLVGK